MQMRSYRDALQMQPHNANLKANHTHALRNSMCYCLEISKRKDPTSITFECNV